MSSYKVSSTSLAHDDTWLGIGYFSTLHSGREILIFNVQDRVSRFITDLQDGPVADLILKVGKKKKRKKKKCFEEF